MNRLRSFIALLGLLVLAAPLSAQLTAKQAVAQAKAASKTRLKQFKQAGKDALAKLDTDLDAVDAGLQSGTTPGEAADSIGTSVIAFLDSTNGAFADAVTGLVDDAAGVLFVFANNADLHGLYPTDFYFGTGGVVDDGRAALDKEAEKLRASASKRIEQSFSKAGKVASLVFALQLRLPSRSLAKELDSGGGSSTGEGPSFDLVLSVSSLDAADDGVLLVSGNTDGFGEDVIVRLLHGADDLTIAASQLGGRFSVTFTDLPEGGYAVSARQGTGPEFSTASIGVR